MDANIILTGATGILGSHLMYELIALKKVGRITGQLVILGRGSKKYHLTKRIQRMLLCDCAPSYLHQFSLEMLMNELVVVSCDLRNIGDAADRLKRYLSDAIVIHAGSSVNLGTDDIAEAQVLQNNHKATLRLLETCLPAISQFIYISTAFASGHRAGKIDDDFLSLQDKQFRNHYEKYKSLTESHVVEMCELHGKVWQILRPSIISGRLIDNPKYVIPKYLVFYLVSDFFSKMAQRYRDKQPLIRIMLNAETSLNVVPVDYAAKAIVNAMLNRANRQLNIVSTESISVTTMFKIMLNKSGYHNSAFVNEMPTELNEVEKFYYKWIGGQLNQYLNTSPSSYKTTQLIKLMQDVSEPQIGEYFGEIIEYAHNDNYKQRVI